MPVGKPEPPKAAGMQDILDQIEARRKELEGDDAGAENDDDSFFDESDDDFD